MPQRGGGHWHRKCVFRASEDHVFNTLVRAGQAVVQLRPEFLRRRSMRALPSFAAPPVMVYLDGIEFETAESIHYVPLGRVRLIKYVSPGEADLRWGRQQLAGAIQVVTMQ